MFTESDLLRFVEGDCSPAEAAAMQEDVRLKDTPLVVMTSLVEERVRQRIRRLRAYLRKPFREADLLKVIQDIFPK